MKTKPQQTDITMTDNKNIVFLTVKEFEQIIEQSVNKALNKIPEYNTELDLIKRKEVAKIFRVSLVTVSDWTKKGLIKSYRVNRKIFYKKNEILDFQKSKTHNE